MNRIEKDIIAGLKNALKHVRGERVQAAAHVVHVPDVRAIRRKLKLSQSAFSRTYRIPIATLKNWEQGRRQPDAPAAAYLQVIALRPREIADVLRLRSGADAT
jgi:putative transcriptional regulator